MAALRKATCAPAVLAAACTLLVCCFFNARAEAAIYGTDPLNIAVSPAGLPANGASGGPALSGDNRFARYAAFHSDASNLVAGDTNESRDIFVWRRPRGSAGLRLDRSGLGKLVRASVSTAGAQANGPSTNAQLDGSLQRAPHCVVFESRATNLSAGDRATDSDIYLRDLRSGRTRLISRGVSEATDPTISGDCRLVAFTADGHVYTAKTRRPRPRRFRAGGDADYSYDGRALAWSHSGTVRLRWSGRTIAVGRGTAPRVSDAARRRRVVGLERHGQVVMVTLSKRGVTGSTLVTSGPGALGGVTAFAADRGIVVFGLGSSLYYLNRHTGNSDDLAHALAPIIEADASARANFVVFTAPMGIGFIGDGNGSIPDIWIKHVVDGRRL